MADRFSYRLNAYNKQTRSVAVDRYSFQASPSIQPLQLLLDESDSKQARALYQIEQRIEKHSKSQATAPSKSTHPRKSLTTPSTYTQALESTISPIVSDLSIDYIRLTKSCITLLNQLRQMWNIELQTQNQPLQYSPIKEGANTNDMGHLLICRDAFEEAKMVRQQAIYTYRAGDGDVHAAKGKFSNDENHACRHGMGLMVAAKVFKHFLAKNNNGEKDFRFPCHVLDMRLLDAEAEAASAPQGQKVDRWRVVRRAESVADLQKELNSSIYVAVNFYTDYRAPNHHMRTFYAGLARKNAVPGVLAFWRANADVTREIAGKCGTE